MFLASFSPVQNNATPLYVASESGHHDVVKTLLGAGADVNISAFDVSLVRSNPEAVGGFH